MLENRRKIEKLIFPRTPQITRSIDLDSCTHWYNFKLYTKSRKANTHSSDASSKHRSIKDTVLVIRSTKQFLHNLTSCRRSTKPYSQDINHSQNTLLSRIERIMKTFTVQIIALLLLQVTDVTAFISQCPKPTAAATAKTITKTASAFRTFAEPTDSSDWEEVEEPDRPKLDSFLEKRYPSFYKLINDDMMLAIKQGGVTIFVPNEKAFKKLGKQKRSQIEDPRNLEIREKMGSYHIIEEESISAVQLAIEDWSRGKPKDGSRPNTMISGINTLSGKVPVGRSKSGGFLGWGAKEDGDIVIGPDAKILQSFNVEGSFVHEVNDLVSPLLLWRYCDQLRIL